MGVPGRLMIGAALGLSTWAVVLGLRLNPILGFVQTPQPSPALQAAPIDGGRIYATACASCHASAGQGRHPVFPPLAGSPWVVGDGARLVSLTLHGMSGPLNVNDIAYDGWMPAFDHLSDEELASVLSFIRTSWGNEAGHLRAAEIAAVRNAISKRQTPWTATELDETDGASR